MVDPNPARGMPIALQRYWLAGKGAAKIRWNTPGDFLRCVRALTAKFPENPEGLCNILHQKATGGPPGHGSAEHALNSAKELADAKALLAAAPLLGDLIWMAPLAPIGVRTGDGRMFTEGSLSFRALPLPLEWAKARLGGHQGAVTIGRILGTTIGPDATGQEYAWGYGDMFPEDLFPEVKQARALIEGGVAGLSLDPGGFVEVLAGEGRQANFTSYRAGGATLVSIPAFEGQRIWLGGPDDLFDDGADDEALEALLHVSGQLDAPVIADGVTDLAIEEEIDCDCAADPVTELPGEAVQLAVNSAGWRGLPIAGRDESVDRDDAIKRIAIWADGDTSKLNRAFLWRHPQGNAQSVYTYRLPVGDIIDGKLMMIYHAIYAASALLEGAHGGLPNIPDSEKDDLRRVISNIYKKMADHFNDPTIQASWDRETKRNNGVSPVEDEEGDKGDFAMPLTELAQEVLGEETSADADVTDEITFDEQDALVASMAPVAPPARWFDHQDISPRAEGLEILPDGQVRGYLALWKTCHRSVGRGTCVKPPRNTTGYQHFRLGSVLTEEGTLIKVGRITIGGGHADPWLGIIPALEHYDNASTAAAIVVPHQDRHGIQLTGGLVPGATPEQVAALRRHQVSGDWRFHDKRMELVAALAVNTPGYPVFAQDGDNMTLLAAMGYEDTEDHEHEEFEMAAEDGAEVEAVIPVETPVEFSGEDVEDLAEKVATRAMDHLERMRQENEHAKLLASHKAFADEQIQQQRAGRLAEVTKL